jgi:hypothetical protein
MWTVEILKLNLIFLGEKKVQPLLDLRKVCVPRDFTQVEFYVVEISLNAYAALGTISSEFD